MELTHELRENAGLQWVLERLSPLSPFGKQAARTPRWYGPGEEAALEEELDNVALAMELRGVPKSQRQETARALMKNMGLEGFEQSYPRELSGGMKKRAGLARALALDPEILYFDEPSAGLDPVSSRHLDDLILDINRSLGTTLVIVSHELASIFAVGSNSIFLDSETKSIIGRGNPKELVKNPPNETVYNFLTRGGEEHGS